MSSFNLTNISISELICIAKATSGGGGWPMSVWLTPDLKPIVGGTYFPPEDRYFGRPGFKTILHSIAEKVRKPSHHSFLQNSKTIEFLKLISNCNIRWVSTVLSVLHFNVYSDEVCFLISCIPCMSL